ncbi:MAG: beta-ketoacyl-ACP synthase II [Deltaproteobacteria bacterium]|nr:beta-ketoacyl-ACP synthase II [Deltaproteobacteria bacterium]MBT4090392.1 beta-ketoacyl-ACP synthase II [Deltaproteobacteria bacterium]MBT4263575.1 beta-ketoacyl-ACP synthase II [Deltaproteobacteria bacterium]MBT4644346.1 beta-ketoacyl-ACP synthase II [Deltaproteobacteria bacterium]MBT6500427.1 beta-ketoacyl-ACP synthase II [Deltaproteobacteria bacterium]
MRKRVVVTGIGTVNPLGNNLEATWDKASRGISGITRITKFDATGFPTQIAGEVKDFDPLAYIEKKELKKMDIFIQYALAACDEAMKMAELEIPEELGPDVGVSIGVGIGGLPTIEQYSNIVKERGPKKITPFFIPMTISNMASGYISMKYGAKGYNATTTSACSSSNHSIGDAARIVERGDAKIMITGGAESTISSLAIGGFGAMKALSRRNDTPEKASRPYDRDRDGFVLGEGCGILILEEYEFARARGAKILAELSGYGVSSDAYHITVPSLEGPVLAMSKAIADADISGEDIDYINAHGTATPVGDINELRAIRLAIGDKAADKVSVSATKSMTGHLLGGAGGLEAVLIILAMQNSLIPPTINIENLDPDCDVDVTPNVAREREIQVAMSNSFGFGGTNATLVFKKI